MSAHLPTGVSHRNLTDFRQVLDALPQRVGQARPASPLLPKQGFNATLHGARGLLALLVVLFHVAQSGVPGFAAQSAGLGQAALVSLQFGVEIFFCISGYIVTGALCRAATPARFVIDRAIRILPVLWVTLAVIIPLGLVTHQSQIAQVPLLDLAWILPVNLLALAGMVPVPVLHLAAWSLSYELTFYAIAAVLWWLPENQKFGRFCTCALATGLTIWHPRAIFFLVGVLVARTDLTRPRILATLAKAPGLTLIAFMAVWYAVQFGGGANGDATAIDWLREGRLSLAIMGVSLAVIAFAGIVAGEGTLGRVLRAPLFTRLGTISYSLYLWHLVVIAAAKRLMAMSGLTAMSGHFAQLVLLGLSLPLSLAVAYVSTRLIEQRFAAWLKQRHVSLPAPNPFKALSAL